jgi:hypothetical protein
VKHSIIAAVIAVAWNAAVLVPTPLGTVAADTTLAPAVPGTPIDTWAWCGVHPDDPTAATAARSMATVAGIDVTFGPCNDPYGTVPPTPYTPANPGIRYVAPAVYRRLVDINASAGMQTVVYDNRMWSANATIRNEAIEYWMPVIDHIAAWDMGDEFDPTGPEWSILITRWDRVLADATARTGVRPFTNHLITAVDDALADLAGAELLLSFTQYSGDLGASVARSHDARVVTTMCGVNALDHFGYTPTPQAIRQGMVALRAAGCDRFLVFGGQRVYDSDNFGEGSLVDTQGRATEWAPPVMEGSGRSSYMAVAPARLLETRVGDGLGTVDGDFNGIGMRAEESVLELGVSGRAGVSMRAVSVVLNVTVTNPTKAGFVTVYPCGTRPNAAQLNHAAGATISASVVAKVSNRGSVCIFTLSDADLVVDVTGFYPEGTTFTATAPARLLETRTGDGLSTIDGQSNGIGVRTAGSTTELVVGGRAGVPVAARTAVLSVTATGSSLPGFVTLFPCGGAVPTAATVNYEAGATVTNSAVVQTTSDGKVCIYTMTDVDLVIDVHGFHPAVAPFVSVSPARLLETRSGAGLSTIDGQQNGLGIVRQDSVVALQVVNRSGVPRTTGSVVLNVTVTNPSRAGFVVVFACGDPRPNAASLNFRAGATISNMVIAEIGLSGTVCVYTMTDTDVVIDITGLHP